MSGPGKAAPGPTTLDTAPGPTTLDTAPGPTTLDTAPGPTTVDLEAVRRAVAAVCDPEYPDLTIAELGMVESVAVSDGHGDGGVVRIALVPTVLGCPALRTIEADVRAAAEQAAKGATVEVRFLAQPAWTPDRLSHSARRRLAEDYTITIRGRDGRPVCPVCGGRNLEERSAFGPTLCRAVYFCPDCRNPVEVIRTAAAFAGEQQ